MNKVILLLFSFVLIYLPSFAQTAYPLTFFWRGELENGRTFEAMLSMLDSDEVINGKGSRLSGHLIFMDNWERFSLRGTADRQKISYNCYDSLGKMCYSFRFDQVDGKNKEHHGEWTNGQKKMSVKMWGNTLKGISASLQDAFAEGVNFRAERLADAPMLKGLAKPLLNKMGEGYLMQDSAFAKVSHYGRTYICFRDTLEDRAMQLDWLLLRSSSFYMLETQQIWKDGKLEGLELQAWSYRLGEWLRVDEEIFPADFIKDKKLQLPKTIESFIMTSDQLVFKQKDSSTPMVWKWDQMRWKIKD